LLLILGEDAGVVFSDRRSRLGVASSFWFLPLGLLFGIFPGDLPRGVGGELDVFHSGELAGVFSLLLVCDFFGER